MPDKKKKPQESGDKMERDKLGRFVPGHTCLSTPAGRPTIPADIKKAFRELTPKAVALLEEILNDPKEKPQYRLKAAEIVLDRAYGKPQQAVEISGSVDTNVVTAVADYVNRLQNS